MGSFTTPPCEQNIVWFVVSKPREIGEAASIMIKEKIKVKEKFDLSTHNI